MDNNDVELNALLGIDSMEPTTNGASAENSTEYNSVTATDDTAATRNEEVSKRAQDRIRELAEENRKLKETQVTSQPYTAGIDGFLSQINDESTRNLFKEYGKAMQLEIDKQYQPVMSTYKEDKFEKEFAQFAEKLPNLGFHKEELKKEFTRNPSSDLKSLIGSRVVDILSSRITPLESKAAQSPRDEVVANLDNASKEDLYAMLKAKKN